LRNPVSKGLPLNKFIEATCRKILQAAGKVTAEIAKAYAETEFEKYRIIQDRLFVSDFDRLVNNQITLNDSSKNDIENE